MANRLVVFPVGKESAALAYQAFANVTSPFAPDPYAYIRNDAFGQWVVPYLGPPFVYADNEVVEPEGGEAARTDGVLVETVVWPDEEA